MRKFAAIFILAIILLLTACGWKGTGTVVDKSYRAGYFYTTTVCSYYGKSGCQSWTVQTNYMPESYSLKLQDRNHEEHTVSVSKDTFTSVKVGDDYSAE